MQSLKDGLDNHSHLQKERRAQQTSAIQVALDSTLMRHARVMCALSACKGTHVAPDSAQKYDGTSKQALVSRFLPDGRNICLTGMVERAETYLLRCERPCGAYRWHSVSKQH